MRLAGLALAALCASCGSPAAPEDPLLPLDEANLAEWRSLCGTEMRHEVGPRNKVVEDPFHTRSSSDVTEVSLWKCSAFSGGWNLTLVARTDTGTVDDIFVNAPAGTTRANFVQWAKTLLLPLVRPESRAAVTAYLEAPAPERTRDSTTGCTTLEYTYVTKFDGCFADSDDENSGIRWVGWTRR